MDFSELLKKRRSYRSIETVEITDMMIGQIYDALKLTPSCFNKQPWRYIFVRDADILNKTFSSLSPGNVWAKKSALMIAVLSRNNYDCQLPDGREYYQFDTGMATAVMVLKIAELGLVAHIMAGYDPQKVKIALNIPESLEVLALISVGKKTDAIDPQLNESQIEIENNQPERLPMDKVIYFDSYREEGK